MPRACDGYFALKKVEAREDIADEWERKELVNNPEKAKERAASWFKKVFKEDEKSTFDALASFPDLCKLRFLLIWVYMMKTADLLLV